MARFPNLVIGAFIVPLVVYLGCIFLRAEVYRPAFMSTDNEANQYIPVSILTTGDMYLDEYIDPNQPYIDNSVTWNGRHYVAFHPVGAAILSLPFYVIAAPFASNLNDWAWALFRIAAAVYTAAGVALLAQVIRHWIADWKSRALLTGLLAFGTPLFSIASQDFYQQTSIFFLQALLISRLQREQCRPGFLSLAIALFLPLCRPTTWLTAGAVALLAMAGGAKSRKSLLLAAALMGIPHALINYHISGSLLPMAASYWASHVRGPLWGYSITANLSGFWLSPTFGVLFFAPIGLAMMWFSLKALAGIREAPRLLHFCIFLFFANLSYISFYNCWFGGYSYGPRFFIDLLPFGFVILAHSIKPGTITHFRTGLLVLAYSFIIQATGAVHFNGEWNENYDRGWSRDEWIWMVKDGHIHHNLKKWFR